MKAIKQYFNGLTFLPIMMMIYTIGMGILLIECHYFYGYSNMPLTLLVSLSLVLTLLYGYNPKKWLNTVQLIISVAFFIALFLSSFEGVESLAAAILLFGVSYTLMLYIEHKNYSF